MKKIVFVLLTMIFILGLLASCNKGICPAYASDPDTEQVENNG